MSFSPTTGGNTATVKALRDSEALYFGINVIDTQLNALATTRDGSVWNDDSIEWFIDTLNDGGGSANLYSAYMLTDDYHGIVSLLNTQYDASGSSSGTPSGSWNGNWQASVKINGTNNNNTDSDNGYSLEVKIPWTSIGCRGHCVSSTTPRESRATGTFAGCSAQSASQPANAH